MSVAVPEVVSIPLSGRRCRDCENDDPDCPERYVSIGELARRAGVSPYRIRKWVSQGRIAHARPDDGNTIYPIRRALSDIKELLDPGP